MKYMILFSMLMSANLFAKEVVCLPKRINAPFEKVVMTKEGRGNKYTLEVIKDGQTVETDDLRNRFVRRNQVNIFNNNDSSIEIKTRRLHVNQIAPSSIKISSLFSGVMAGVCKMYE